MLEPFEKGRININELLNHSWLIDHTQDKREQVKNHFYGDKMIVEMMKIQYRSQHSNKKIAHIEINKYFHIQNLKKVNYNQVLNQNESNINEYQYNKLVYRRINKNQITKRNKKYF
jgi:hypothetical protein